MAFAYTRTFREVIGRSRCSAGTFTNGSSDTGGDIDTGIKSISYANVSFTGHVDSGNPKFTVSAPTITVLCDEGADGYWIAIGRT